MPSPNRSTRRERAPTCSYVEGGRRCGRSAAGNPPVCEAHLIVLQAAALGGESVGDLVSDVLNGRRVSRARVAQATAQVVQGFMAAIGRPPVFQPGQPAGPPPPRRPPPPPRTAADERVLLELRLNQARKALGIALGAPISLELVQQRRRTLARKHHPDRGGSQERMQEINSAADLLIAHLQNKEG